jgi:hypothetical protein
LARNPSYLYIAINDVPKIESLKRLFPEFYRSHPVLVAGSSLWTAMTGGLAFEEISAADVARSQAR